MKRRLLTLLAALALAAHAFAQAPAMDDAPFAKLMREILAKLPASALPAYLKTDKQRADAEFAGEGGVLILNKFSGEDGAYEQFDLAGYLCADKENVVALVHHGSGLDGFSSKFFGAFNYSLKDKKLAKIEPPLAAFTADELIDPAHFPSAAVAKKAKAHFAKKPKLTYTQFDKNGFRVFADLWEFEPGGGWQFYGAECRRILCTWDGKRFVKTVAPKEE
jgi:hypothetical protein